MSLIRSNEEVFTGGSQDATTLGFSTTEYRQENLGASQNPSIHGGIELCFPTAATTIYGSGGIY